MYKKMVFRKEKSGDVPKEHFADPEEAKTESAKMEEPPALESTSGGIGVGPATASSLSFE